MISIFLNGRLGNQMFQYAICRIIAHINNYKFYIPRTGEPSTEGIKLKDYFPSRDLGEEIEIDILHNFREDYTIQSFNPDLLKLSDNTKLFGFYQTPKYFEDYKEIVREWFKIDLDEKTKLILEKYPIDKYCYIHLRATDYKHHTHWYLDFEFYKKSIQYIKEKNPSISFLVITDDIEESKKIFPEFDCISNEMMVDFNLMLNSKFLIISNSTFSWWAAWLKDKEIIIAPDNWLNYNKPHLGFYPKDIKTKEFIYI